MTQRDGARTRWFPVAALLVLGCAHAAAAPAAEPAAAPAPVDASDPIAYTEAAAARLGAAIEGHTVAVGDGELELVVDDRWVVSLGRPFDDCELEADRCEAITGEYLASVAEMVSRAVADAAPTPENLRLALRPRALLDEYAARGVADVVSEPFLGDIAMVVMVDFPESARTLTEADLAALGLDRAGAIARARANVIEELGVFAPAEVPSRGDLALGAAAGYYYESSRLLTPESLELVAQSLGGELLVSVPEYGVLLFAENAGDHAVLAMIAVTTEVAAQSAQPLSAHVFLYRAGRIELLR